MKRIKMVLYGEPGTGKSVFALGAPKPFFITTDGNYEWLEDFGAKEEDHIQVSTWSEAKKAFNNDYEEYETIVVDLAEDLFKWCEYEFCKKNKLDHVSDIGFGKGYDITRNEYYVEISKLLAKDKNVILLMHGLTVVEKDRRGVEHTKYTPTNRIPDKVIDMIEGRVRYFLRCYLKGEEIEGKIIKKRYLSLIPKENEFGIIRGVDENTVPHDINLDFNEFMNVIGINNTLKKTNLTKNKVSVKKPVVEELDEECESCEELVKVNDSVKKIEEPLVEVNPEIVKQREEESDSTKTEVISTNDKLKAIKAKLAAAKLKKERGE